MSGHAQRVYADGFEPVGLRNERVVRIELVPLDAEFVFSVGKFAYYEKSV